MKHTPPPWRMLPEEVDKPYIRIRGTKWGRRYKIANVLSPVYDGIHAREAEETRANARIMVVAPEMLETLQLAFPHVREQAKTDGHAFGVLQVMDSLIKKALGEV